MRCSAAAAATTARRARRAARCDFYSSIYHNSSGYRETGVELQTLEQFKTSPA